MFKEVFEKVPANVRIEKINAMIAKHKANPVIAREFGGNVFYDKETLAIVGVCIRKFVFDESQIPPKVAEKVIEKEAVSEEEPKRKKKRK